MTTIQYTVCVSEASAYADPESYVSDLSLSSIWGDDPASPIPQDRIDLLSEIYTAAHRSIKDISAAAGISNRQLADRFGIPQRTLENWSNGSRQCPTYLLLLMQEALGIYKIF